MQSRQAGFIPCFLNHPNASKSVSYPVPACFSEIPRKYILKAIPHKDCAADASSNFSSDETKSGVNTLCIHEHFCEI